MPPRPSRPGVRIITATASACARVSRFAQGGAEAPADYELLELVLFRAIPRRDVKPLAKALIRRFGSFAEVLAAEPVRMAEVEGLGP